MIGSTTCDAHGDDNALPESDQQTDSSILGESVDGDDDKIEAANSDEDEINSLG